MRERTLDLLSEWTAIPSVAGNDAALRAMAASVTSWLRRHLGAEIIADGANSLVHARIDGGYDRTILLYNMYDVMPASPDGWVAPPFTGGIVDLPGLGPSFVGRGAENNKGPLAGMLVALAALGSALAANVEILIEGEEESGSQALRHYLLDPATPVRRCDAALFPSFCEYGGGPPRVFLGSKGIAHGVIRVTGPARPIHSSNISWMENPAWSLVAALNAVGPNGALGHIGIPTDSVAVLTALAAAFDADAELRFRGATGYTVGGDSAARLEAVLTAISLNLASLSTDPPAGRAAIPATAEARFDLRLPPGVDPDRILAQLRTGLGRAELLVEDCYPGYRFAAADPAAGALCACYRAAGVEPQIWPWAIGAAPVYAFAAVGGNLLTGGLGHAGHAHGPNEFVTLAGLDRFLGFMMEWLPETARRSDHDGL